ncbi:MAG: DUF1080 domain-containing protein [Prevotella sp.]|nr:DUF1080 domain-containing protein [Prevotella sp.]
MKKVNVLILSMLLIGLTTVAQAQQNNDTPTAKLLKLRTEMEQASTPKQQQMLIGEMGQTETFVALVTVGKYLDNPQLQKAAAREVARIALAHPEYDGYNTRQLLAKAYPFVGGKQRKAIVAQLAKTPTEGFVSHFNGRDLTGWKGLVENPIVRENMTPLQLAKAQVEADQRMRDDWKVEDGLLAYTGNGYDNICTVEQYADFEMLVDWRLDPNGDEPDAGIYLRGTPQVQIWDIARVNVGAQVGSGGLYNNQVNKDIPLCVADNKLGEWNSFHIKMVGDRVTVYLNGILVVDSVVLENYWDRSRPIFPIEQIELQAHGSKVYYRDIYIKRL